MMIRKSVAMPITALFDKKMLTIPVEIGVRNKARRIKRGKLSNTEKKRRYKATILA